MRIDIATAQELISNYKQNHWTIINGCCPSLRQNPAYPKIQDSRSVWFGTDELQDFIEAINQAGGNGIRFYFGEYSADIINGAINDLQQNQGQVDTDDNEPDLQSRIMNLSQCIGLQTLVMIPTMYNAGSNMNCDYNIVTQDTTFNNPTDLTAENHGGLVPPPYEIASGASGAVCGTFFMDFADTQ